MFHSLQIFKVKSESGRKGEKGGGSWEGEDEEEEKAFLYVPVTIAMSAHMSTSFTSAPETH